MKLFKFLCYLKYVLHFPFPYNFIKENKTLFLKKIDIYKYIINKVQKKTIIKKKKKKKKNKNLIIF